MWDDDAEESRRAAERAKKEIAAREFYEEIQYQIKEETRSANLSTVVRVPAAFMGDIDEMAEALRERDYSVTLERDGDKGVLRISWQGPEG